MKPHGNITYEGRVIATILGPGKVVVGEETFVTDLTRTYIKFTFLHSFPFVNENGMTFVPANIAKAIGTIINQPMNRDHQLEGNPEAVFDGENIIVGTMVSAFTDAKEDSPLIPEEPFSVEVVAALWMRNAEARRIVESIGEGEKEYKVSMEAIAVDAEHGWYVNRDGEWSYQESITSAELDLWKNKEHDKVALAVGGNGDEGKTIFWGGGFTLNPADDEATINDVLTGSLDREGIYSFAAHAHESKSVAGNDNTKKEKKEMEFTFKQFTAMITAFLSDVSGSSLEFGEGDKKLTKPSVGLYAWPVEGGDEYMVSANVVFPVEGDPDKTIAYEYWDKSTEGVFAQVLDGVAAKMVNISSKDLEAKIATAKASVASEDDIRAEYKDYLSPQDAEAAIKGAVAAAAQGKDDLYTKAEVDAQVETKVAAAVASNQTKRDVLDARCVEVKKAGFAVTDARKTVVASFNPDDAGNGEFKTYLTSLRTDNDEMLKALADKGIESTEQIRAAVAMLDNCKSPGFKAMLTLYDAPSTEENFSPSVASQDGNPNSNMTV